MDGHRETMNMKKIALWTLAIGVALPIISHAQPLPPETSGTYRSEEKINALADTIAGILDDGTKGPCRDTLSLLGKAIVCVRSGRECSQTGCRQVGSNKNIWTISERELEASPFVFELIGDKFHLIYKPLVNGARNLGGLEEKEAVVTPAELETTNSRVRLYQGKKTIEKLRQSIENKGQDLFRDPLNKPIVPEPTVPFV